MPISLKIYTQPKKNSVAIALLSLLCLVIAFPVEHPFLGMMLNDVSANAETIPMKESNEQDSVEETQAEANVENEINKVKQEEISNPSSKQFISNMEANNQPLAKPSNVETESGRPTIINLGGFDSDSGEKLTTHIDSKPTYGGLTDLDEDKAVVTYTSQPNFVGTDVFSFEISDGKDISKPAEIVINVHPILKNNPPEAKGDSFAMTNAETLRINLAASDTDSGEDFSFSIKRNPTFGQLSDLKGNVIVYTPKPDFTGADQFTYSVSDGEAEATAEIHIHVEQHKNHTPVAKAGTIDAYSYTPIDILLSAEDEDSDEKFSFQIKNNPTKGTLGYLKENFVTYNPSPDAQGTDEFTFIVSDGKADSAPASVIINLEYPPKIAGTESENTRLQTKGSLVKQIGNSVSAGDKEDFTVNSIHAATSLNNTRSIVAWAQSSMSTAKEGEVVTLDGSGSYIAGSSSEKPATGEHQPLCRWKQIDGISVGPIINADECVATFVAPSPLPTIENDVEQYSLGFELSVTGKEGMEMVNAVDYVSVTLETYNNPERITYPRISGEEEIFRVDCSPNNMKIINGERGEMACAITNNMNKPLDIVVECSGLEDTGVSCYLDDDFEITNKAISVKEMSQTRFLVSTESRSSPPIEEGWYPFVISVECAQPDACSKTSTVD